MRSPNTRIFDGDARRPTFMQFLSGMAVQTLVHLGKMSNPVTNETKVDLPNAQYSIDLLAVLQQKTKGNLTAEEDAYLANALRDLRMEYVEVAKTAKPADGA